MCEGFGLVIDKELNAWFCEPEQGEINCSHTKELKRLGWVENTSEFIRSFVRVQYPDWIPGSFEFDEESTLPGWAEEHRQEIQDKCNRVLAECAVAWAKFLKVRAPALAEYKKVRAAALANLEKVHDPALAEYEKVRDAAQAKYGKIRATVAEYEKVRDAAWDEYEKVRDAARAEFEKVRTPAQAEYEKVRDAALAEYEKAYDPAWDELVQAFAKVPGYVFKSEAKS